nr:unnamed protein product [Timema monikensis]
MTLDQLTYIRCLRGPDATTIELNEKDFIDRARLIDIHDVKPFYESKIFKANNYTYDLRRKLIIQTIPEAGVVEK